MLLLLPPHNLMLVGAWSLRVVLRTSPSLYRFPEYVNDIIFGLGLGLELGLGLLRRG
jgi:hypothetical protein